MTEKYKPFVALDTRIPDCEEKLLVEEINGKIKTPRIKGDLEVVWPKENRKSDK